MADRVVDPENNELHEIDPTLREIAKAALDEAAEKLINGEEVVPFTILAVKDNLFVETHKANTAAETFELAMREVMGARGATGYAFCYDGYLDTNKGQRDCLIAECGLPGEPAGVAFGFPYDDDGIYRDELTYIGPCPNFMERLKLELEMEAPESGDDFDANAAVEHMEQAIEEAEAKTDSETE
jgi:hypothetical protein